jgi:hypothetical protein
MFPCSRVIQTNFTAAKFHTRILGELFPNLKIPMDYNLLRDILRLDATLAVMNLTRSSLDVETWIPEVFAPFHKPLLELPESISLDTINRNVDGSILNDDKFKIFL